MSNFCEGRITSSPNDHWTSGWGFPSTLTRNLASLPLTWAKYKIIKQVIILLKKAKWIIIQQLWFLNYHFKNYTSKNLGSRCKKGFVVCFLFFSNAISLQEDRNIFGRIFALKARRYSQLPGFSKVWWTLRALWYLLSSLELWQVASRGDLSANIHIHPRLQLVPLLYALRPAKRGKWI